MRLSTYVAQFKMLNRNIWLSVSSGAVVGFSVWGGMYTVLLNLYLLRLGYGPEYIGAVNGSGLAAVALLSIPAGSIGNRIGLRKAMMLGLLMQIIGFAILPFGEFVPGTGRGIWILAFYFLGFSGLAIWAVNLSPYLAYVTDDNQRTLSFSLRFGFAGLAAFLGSLSSGFILQLLQTITGTDATDPLPYRIALIFAGLCIAVGLGGTSRLKDVAVNETEHKPEFSGPLPLAIIIILTLFVFFSVIGEGSARTFFNVYMEDVYVLSVKRIAAIVSISQLLSIPAIMATPLVADKLGKAGGITVIYGAIALAVLPLALTGRWAIAGLSYIAILTFQAIGRTLITVYQQESVAPVWRPVISGSTTMSAGLGMAMAAFGGGFVITSSGYRLLYILATAMAIVAVLIAGGHLIWKAKPKA